MMVFSKQLKKSAPPFPRFKFQLYLDTPATLGFLRLVRDTLTYLIYLRERFKKKIEKKLTNVSFAFTHTYTPVKTNIFRFFPQSYMENFEKCAKTQKRKNNMLSHVTCGLLVFPPLFLGTFP